MNVARADPAGNTNCATGGEVRQRGGDQPDLTAASEHCVLALIHPNESLIADNCALAAPWTRHASVCLSRRQRRPTVWTWTTEGSKVGPEERPEDG
jgi:hypothetical protein